MSPNPRYVTGSLLTEALSPKTCLLVESEVRISLICAIAPSSPAHPSIAALKTQMHELQSTDGSIMRQCTTTTQRRDFVLGQLKNINRKVLHSRGCQSRWKGMLDW
jgi:hypothetical protein